MLAELTALYDGYVDAYRGPDGTLPVMMQLKRTHTAFVVKNAEAIADGEAFSPRVRELALAAALLHDTGRYEQLKRYDTFRDADSIDHAVFSHDIVAAEGWLDRVGRFAGDDGWKAVVLKAVLYHNRRDLPEEARGDSELALVAQTVRDADKLDIFRVLEDRLEHSDWRHDSRAFWNLAVDAPPSPEVVACIARGLPVDYQNIRCLADFVLVQIGWMISGLRFETSRRLCRERGHLAYRRRFLHSLTDSPEVDRLCDLCEKTM